MGKDMNEPLKEKKQRGDPKNVIPYRFSKDDPDYARAMSQRGKAKLKENRAKKIALLRNISLVMQAKLEVTPEMNKTLKKMGIKALKNEVASSTLAAARIMQRVIASGDYKGFESLMRMTGHTYDQMTGVTEEGVRLPDSRPKFSPEDESAILRRMGVTEDV